MKPGTALVAALLLAAAARPARGQAATPAERRDSTMCDTTAQGGSEGADPRAVQPERPSVATHAGTVAQGYLELETGVERDRPGDGSTALSVPTELKMGLAPRLQLSLFLPSAGQTGVPFGLGDVAAGVKWRVVQGDPILRDVAVLPIVKLSTGGATRGTGTTDATLILIDSRTVGAASLDLNLGGTWRSGDGSAAPRFASLWTVSFGVPVRGPLGLALECYGYPGTAGPAGAAPIVAILAGPTFTVRSDVAVDLGTIVPVRGPQAHALYAGLVVSLGRLLAPRLPGT